MEEEILQKYLRAGKIAAEVREEARGFVKVGEKIVDIAERIERMIIEKGASPAFPVNISINEVSAHYTPTRNDVRVIKEGDVVKIDVGVHVDGYIGDTALTLSFNKDFDDLIKASDNALDEAMKLCRPEEKLSNVSSVIQETIEGFGFKPISNLTGHKLDRFDLHGDPHIPNVKFDSDYRLEEDHVFAVEPFATNGSGKIKESNEVLIFSLLQIKPVRNLEARKIIELASDLNGLPFAERWIENLGFSLFKTRLALKELRTRDMLHDYPVLKEIANGIVSQSEHTVIIKDPPVITTL